MELFIPTKINNDNIFAKGIGKKEMKRIVIGAFIGLVFGFTFGLLFTDNLQSTLIATIISATTFTFISYFVVLKTSINLSFYVYIGLFKNYIKEQKYYKYKKQKEWF